MSKQFQLQKKDTSIYTFLYTNFISSVESNNVVTRYNSVSRDKYPKQYTHGIGIVDKSMIINRSDLNMY